VPALRFVIGCLMAGCLSAGCPRVMSLDYVPSNPLRGHGRVQVDTFEYRAAEATEKGFEKKKEMEEDGQEIEVVYLSQNIDTFFTNALKSELRHSGYDVRPEQDVAISGVIDRFYFDYEGPDGQVFEIRVVYRVRRSGSLAYSEECESRQQRATALTTSGLVIKAGIKECIERFIRGAQAARVL
jgi:hypothetical protein